MGSVSTVLKYMLFLMVLMCLMIHKVDRAQDTIRCLAVGRMVAKKAPTFTLEAFRRALLGNPRLRLDYVGDGELFDEARQFVRDEVLSDKVVLHGSQPNPVVQESHEKCGHFLTAQPNRPRVPATKKAYRWRFSRPWRTACRLFPLVMPVFRRRFLRRLPAIG